MMRDPISSAVWEFSNHEEKPPPFHFDAKSKELSDGDFDARLAWFVICIEFIVA